MNKMKPRHLPIKNTRTRDLRNERLREKHPLEEHFIEQSNNYRKRIESEETQYD